MPANLSPRETPPLRRKTGLVVFVALSVAACSAASSPVTSGTTTTTAILTTEAPATTTTSDAPSVDCSLQECPQPSATSSTLAPTGGSGLPPASFMGTNLEHFAEYAEWALVDVFKMSAPWVSGVAWTPDGPPYQWDDGRPLDVDAQGWVRSLLPGQIARTTMLWGPLPTRPAGRYVVLYEGEGTLSYGGSARLVSSAPGRDVLEVDATAGIELDIVAANPGNYVRNIRVIMPGGIYASDPYTLVTEPDPARSDWLSFEEHYSEIVFHPDFLASLRGFAAVRFSGWQHPNDSTEVSWADRPHPDDARWTTQGVPLEIICQLANRVGFDPWFNLSYQADDDYFRQAATLIRDQLDPALTPYIEYSNEVWNTVFPQYAYARSQGLALQLDTDPNRAAIRYYARRATQMFTIFETVYADRPQGFTAVAGSSEWTADITSLILDYPDTAAHTDLVAIGGYFGFEATWNQNCDRIANMTIDQFLDYLATEALPLALQRTQAHLPITQAHNIPLAIYEGGQHLTVNDCAGNTAKRQTIEDLFDQANRDPRIKDIYLTHFTNTWQAGTTLYAHYLNTGKWTPDGRFGSREHLNQTRQQAPKYDAIQTILDNRP